MWKESLRTGVIPTPLKVGTICPIYKGGDRTKPKNYRPVTLTSHVIKIFEKVIVKYLSNYLENNNLFNDQQHGFRNKRSCLSQLLDHFHRIVESLNEGKDVDVVYLDFAKAFDKVDPKILLKKIFKIGIRGKLYQWIRSFLTNRKQKVCIEGTYSQVFDVKSGVPQG